MKAIKKFNRFSDTQKKYLEEKFNLGQTIGQKQDPINVARKMRFAKKMDGSKLFKRDEYLTTQQVQCFFSRTAAKCRCYQGELSAPDIMAAEEQQQMDDTREAILQEVQLQLPILYMTT